MTARRRARRSLAIVAVLLGGAAIATGWTAPDPEGSTMENRAGPAARASEPARPTVSPRISPRTAKASRAAVAAPRTPKIVAVDVRTTGAVGDGTRDDTVAIQRAIDVVAARGGGEVRFPPGTYAASGVGIPSGVTLVGPATAVLRHPDGVARDPILRSAVESTTGTLEEGSLVLRMTSARTVREGARVAVRGAGEPSGSQRGRLAAAIGPSTTTIVLRDGRGFADGSTYARNHLVIGDEVISYTGRSGGTLLGVQRGRFGTDAVSHPGGAVVAQSSVLYATVREVRGTTVTLDRPGVIGVRDATVWVGAVHPGVMGLSLDGNRRSGGSDVSNPMPVEFRLASGGRIEGCRITDGDHGGVSLDQGTVGTIVRDNVFADIGTPSRGLGAAVWLFRGATRNRIESNVIGGDSVNGIYIDDRTIQSTEFDADSSRNIIRNNDIRLPAVGSNIGIAVLGSSDNRVAKNSIFGTTFGIRVYTGGQGAVPPPTSRNTFEDNDIEQHGYGIWVDGEDNVFRDNTLARNEIEVLDKGSGNRFE